MSMFLTHLLFLAPWLWFSEAQKKAMLKWGKELGASDVPTLYGLNTCTEKIEELLGQPIKQVTTGSGNVFFINDVAKAIANQFVNPFICYAMSDYPHNGNGGASQIHSSAKWLTELLWNLTTLTAQVDDRLYFIGELLKCKEGGYLIPDWFFTQTHTDEEYGSVERLYALGND
ncbi:hypothetical protein Moror_15721, partial [Moniliophthora roreri MCA 2997]